MCIITVEQLEKTEIKSELSGEYSVAIPEDIFDKLLSELQKIKYHLDNIEDSQ